MKKIATRLLVGLMIAIPLMLVSFALAKAGSISVQSPQATPATELICPACHESFQTAWEQSAHANSMKSEAFQAEWAKQGSPGECLTCHTTRYDPDTDTYMSDAITCAACHDTTTANHPMEPMAADRSAKLCGTCHTETYFEWQASAHRQNGIDCISCHDVHSTNLKAADAAEQCASCHRDRASNYAMSAHSKEGLSCADCHLAKLDGGIEGHARLDHSFGVKLGTCNECHAYQMHDPSEVHPEHNDPASVPVDALSAVESSVVVSEPSPVSPVGFAVIAGLFGLAAGAVVAPWLEKAARRRGSNKEE